MKRATGENGKTSMILHDIEIRSVEDIVIEDFQERLPEQLRYVIANSEFYRRKWPREFNSESEVTIDSFAELPFTDKKELIEDQINFAPFGSNVCTDKSEILRVHKTSGSTGRPLLLVFTEEDLSQTVMAGARCFWASGLRPVHTVIHCLNYRLWAGGFTDHQSLEATGACVIPYGVGKTDNLIETMLMLKPEVIHCTPSYLSRIEIVLETAYGMTPQDLHLSLGLFGAEGGLEDSNFRKEIEEKWGFSAMNANYGMSDVLSMFGAECKERNGLHFMGQGIVLPELIDIGNCEKLPLETGVVGELVLTNLNKRAQPLVRYRTRDVIQVMDNNVCRCGRWGFRFKVVGRSDDMIVVKGINVFPGTIAAIINNHLDYFTGEYQILVDREKPIKRLLLKIEVKPIELADQSLVVEQVRHEMERSIGIRPELKLVKSGSIKKGENKSKRIEYLL